MGAPLGPINGPMEGPMGPLGPPGTPSVFPEQHFSNIHIFGFSKFSMAKAMYVNSKSDFGIFEDFEVQK